MPQWREAPAIAACVLLAVLAPAAPSAAQIYKWVDEAGTTHFSNDPPPRRTGAPAVEVLPETEHRPRNPPASASAGAADAGAGRGPLEDEPRDAPDAAAEDVEPEAIIVEDYDAVIVEEGQRDLVTPYRAHSPRNRPGQPIRQPVRQPRQPRRGR
jgi:hypothetical protein